MNFPFWFFFLKIDPGWPMWTIWNGFGILNTTESLVTITHRTSIIFFFRHQTIHILGYITIQNLWLYLHLSIFQWAHNWPPHKKKKSNNSLQINTPDARSFLDVNTNYKHSRHTGPKNVQNTPFNKHQMVQFYMLLLNATRNPLFAIPVSRQVHSTTTSYYAIIWNIL